MLQQGIDIMKFKIFKNNIMILTTILIIISVIFSGCNESGSNLTNEEEQLIGTWFGGGLLGDVVSFFPDHTCCYYLDLSGKWKIEDSKITIDLKDRTEILEYEIETFENETTLRLTPTGTASAHSLRKQ